MKPLFLALLLVVSAQADIPGDVNQSGSVNIADVMALVDYIFNGVEIPRTEWVERNDSVTHFTFIDRTVSTSRWPISEWTRYSVLVDSTGRVDTVTSTFWIIEQNATYPSGNSLIKTR